TAPGRVLVDSFDEFGFEIGSGSLAFGLNKAGIGGAIAVPVVNKTTTATVHDNAMIDASALRSGFSVPTGDFQAFSGDTSQTGVIGQADLDYSGLPTAGDKSYFKDRNATPIHYNGFEGVSVTALSKTEVELYGAGAALSIGGGSFQVSFGYSDIDETTTARVGNSVDINQNTASASSDQSVNVAAGNDLFMRTVLGAIAGGSKLTASPAADVLIVSMDTSAAIGANSRVRAKRDVNVQAYNEEDVIGVSVSLAGTIGGAFAGAGAVVAFDLDNTTYASIGDGSTVDAGGNVVVFAEDRTDADIVAGGVGASITLTGGGIGASISASLLDKDTQAWIGSATVDALGNGTAIEFIDGEENGGTTSTTSTQGVAVGSLAVEDVFVLSVAGGVGGIAGVAGAINWQKIDSDVGAEIRDGARINQASDNATAANSNQDVYVVALNKIGSTGIAGALGLGLGLGVGAGVDVGTVDNAVIARLGGNVSARRDVRVASLADREIYSVGAAGGLGGAGVGLAGGVSRWVINGNVDAAYSVQGVTGDALVGENGQGQSVQSSAEASLNQSTSINTGYEGAGNARDNSSFVANSADSVLGGIGNFSNLLTAIHVTETRAEINPNANVTAGSDVEVEASEVNDIYAAGGAATIG
ncbi:MAG: hypothetical protein AAGJ83_13540, partial [Planctomycetota bacterium]